jgi:hypothetical protein
MGVGTRKGLTNGPYSALACCRTPPTTSRPRASPSCKLVTRNLPGVIWKASGRHGWGSARPSALYAPDRASRLDPRSRGITPPMPPTGRDDPEPLVGALGQPGLVQVARSTMRRMPALRGLRGSVVGLSAAGLGVAGHAMAGGMLPSGPMLAVATAGLVLLGVAMSARAWGLPSLLTVLVGAQLAFHVAMAGTSHAHAMAGMSHQGTVPGLEMAGAHLLAAVITAVLLLRGERWCEALIELLRRPLRAVLLTILPVLRPREISIHTADTTYVICHLAHSVSRRGPPALSLA